MNVVQKGEFKRVYRRLHNNQLTEVNVAIEKVIHYPLGGEIKKGDLSRVRVYKFKVLDQLFPLTYEHNGENLTLRALGPHENFWLLAIYCGQTYAP
jgi:hypothetical protein